MSELTPSMGTFASTMGPYDDPQFRARAHLIPVPPRFDMHPKVRSPLRDEIQLFARVLQAARREPTLLLFSSRGRFKPELLAAIAIGFWPRRWRPHIVLYGEMYEPNAGLQGWIERRLVRLADRAIDRYAVHSSAECDTFAATWNIDCHKMRVSHVFYPDAHRIAVPSDRRRGAHIFAGGNSFRDYNSLIEAARRMPDHQFVISTNRLEGRADLPPNVAAKMVGHEQFVELMETAAVVVVPLQLGLRRGAGMMTYLEAMALGKLTIVSDSIAVREYITDGETGLIVDGSPEGYVHAIQWALDPSNQAQVDRICRQAQAAVLQRFTVSNYVAEILAIIDEVTAEQVR